MSYAQMAAADPKYARLLSDIQQYQSDVEKALGDGYVLPSQITAHVSVSAVQADCLVTGH